MIKRRPSTLALAIIAHLAIGLPAYSYASNDSIAQDKALTTQNNINTLVELTNSEIQRVIAGLQNYYVTNGGWPTNISAIGSAGGYYSGSFNTPYGNITGSINANSFDVVVNTSGLDTTTQAAIKSMAAKRGGSFTSNKIAFSVDKPQNSAVVEAMLSRLPDTTGSGLNTMMTSIDMGGFNIENASSLNSTNVISNNATIANLNSTTVNADSATINTGTINNLTAVNTTATTLTATTTTTDSLTAASTTTDTLAATSGNISSLTSDNAIINSGELNTAKVGTLDVTGVINSPLANIDHVNTNTVESDLAIITKLKSPTGIIGIDSTLNVAGDVTAVQGTFSELLTTDLTTGNAVVSNSLTVNGQVSTNGKKVIDSTGRLFYQGQDLDSRFLGINDKAASALTADTADRLGGIEAKNFARRDVENSFTNKQTFTTIDVDSGEFNTITSGELSTETLEATNVKIRQNLELNGQISVNGIKITDKNGRLFYQGQDIESKFLGIDDKAKTAAVADTANQLGGVDASRFARNDIQNTYTAEQTFADRVNVNSSLYANNKIVVDTSGALYYQGQKLDSRYLGINAKAKTATLADNANQLGGISATTYARKDTKNLFTEDQVFANNISVVGQVRSAGDIIVGGELFAGRTKIADRNGKIFYEGENLDSRFLKKGGTAINAQNLGGITASSYARLDAQNTWSDKQTFSSGIVVVGGIISDSVNTKNLTVNGQSLNNVTSDLTALRNEIADLETKISDGGGSEPKEWKSIYNGSTYGTIQVPSDATEVYIRSNMGEKTFPLPRGAGTLWTDTYYDGYNRTIGAYWSGSSISGSYVEYTTYYDCRGGEHTCSRDASIGISIHEVRVK